MPTKTGIQPSNTPSKLASYLRHESDGILKPLATRKSRPSTIDQRETMRLLILATTYFILVASLMVSVVSAQQPAPQGTRSITLFNNSNTGLKAFYLKRGSDKQLGLVNIGPFQQYIFQNTDGHYVVGASQINTANASTCWIWSDKKNLQLEYQPHRLVDVEVAYPNLPKPASNPAPKPIPTPQPKPQPVSLADQQIFKVEFSNYTGSPVTIEVTSAGVRGSNIGGAASMFEVANGLTIQYFFNPNDVFEARIGNRKYRVPVTQQGKVVMDAQGMKFNNFKVGAKADGQAPSSPPVVPATTPALPKLGFNFQMYTDATYRQTGMYVRDVVAGGKAQAMGLQPGHLITEINGKPTNTVEGYQHYLSQAAAGDGRVVLTVRKDLNSYVAYQMVTKVRSSAATPRPQPQTMQPPTGVGSGMIGYPVYQNLQTSPGNSWPQPRQK
jgi:hypothetical protein